MASSESEATVGRIMTPITRPAESALKTSTGRPMSCKQRRDERQREIPVDDGRDACQHLQHGLQVPARPGRGVLGQVDRRPEPERQSDDAGPERRAERSDDEWKNAEARRLEERRPIGAGQVLEDADFSEELDRRLGESHHDPDCRGDRNERTQKEEGLDRHFPVARPRPEPARKKRAG